MPIYYEATFLLIMLEFSFEILVSVVGSLCCQCFFFKNFVHENSSPITGGTYLQNSSAETRTSVRCTNLLSHRKHQNKINTDPVGKIY